MTIFVDASALVAMMTKEPGDGPLVDALVAHKDRFCSVVVQWEAAVAVARKREVRAAEAIAEVADFLATFAIRSLAIGAEDLHRALEAYDRYGKRSKHRAQLNMGDCFAYGCAKTKGAALLYKGDDFARTDLA